MTKLVVALLTVLSSTSAFAAEINASCKVIPGQEDKDTILIEDKFDLNISGKKILVTVSPRKSYKGEFAKVASNGYYRYESTDLTQEVDQADKGNIFVSPALHKGKNGPIALSVRQLGDSEGAWWLTQNFNCTVEKR